ncbi:cobalt transporter [Herbaspirillum sp. AP02]|uniref:cobalt transporter n=1 Tax=unclassified Herbaspirillum TaxID=2624150 RepID=UPI0018C8DB0F|nr:cobalt transporter [Herbaspirillum sp. AP02]MBG7621961.1 cobalt transporter [Herbaspirillum sp. AP02]
MRALILFLALLLPLQLSWAAVASYCQPEKETHGAAPAGHPGHHEHVAAPAGDEASPDARGNAGQGGDADAACPVCQLSCMKSMQWQGAPMAEQIGTALDVFSTIAPHPTSHIADGPDKPNWPLAA